MEEKKIIITPETLKKYGKSIHRPGDAKRSDTVPPPEEQPAIIKHFNQLFDELESTPEAIESFIHFLSKFPKKNE
ncbi:MAG: hypothetical protein QM526_01295 [Alphaproteobacteria bacterium]|nr:hypothetical protein [Alphaproteobacteria bacterium]